MPETLLEARRLTKQFPLRAGRWRSARRMLHAVEDVNLAIAPGECVGLVGESGCGKSTCAKLLVGLLLPTAGEVLFNGTPLQDLRGASQQAFRRAVQLIFQDPTNSLNPRMQVDELVAEPLDIHRLATGQARASRVEELLHAVQLSPTLRRRRPHELSGGERQRVGIARALATNPRLLICDEPIASLDVSVGAQILALLRQITTTRGLSLVFISHDLRAVAFLCESIAVMYLGRIVEQAPTAQLLASPWHPYTELLLQCASLDLRTDMRGEPPSNIHPPSGCPFRTRCALAEPICERETPLLLSKGPARLVACHKRP